MLPALLFTGFVLYGSLDPTHHWFSTFAVMAAMLVLLDGTNCLHPAQSSSVRLDAFRAYLVKNYHLTRTFQNGDDVWQKI